MKKAFPNPSLSPFEAVAHLEAWAEIAENVGQERFETALKKCISECRFFPKREEIEVRIPKTGTKLVGVTDPRCPDCQGHGWMQKDPSNRFNPFSRCHCWRKEMRSA